MGADEFNVRQPDLRQRVGPPVPDEKQRERGSLCLITTTECVVVVECVASTTGSIRYSTPSRGDIFDLTQI